MKTEASGKKIEEGAAAAAAVFVKVTVLVVDDEESIRRNFRISLEDLGHRAMAAANGREGLEIFLRERPDIVLTDLHMPEMDGMDLLSTIKKLDPDIPIVIVSGTGTLREAVEAIRLGAWDFIVKPVLDEKELEQAIQRNMERARLQVENRNYREHLEVLVTQRTEDLTASEQKFAKIFQKTPMLLAISSLVDGRFIDVNDAWLDTLGFRRDEVIGRTSQSLELFGNSDWRTKAIRLIQAGGSFQGFEMAVQARDGRIRHGMMSADIVQLKDQQVLLTLMNDITERRQAENELRENEERFRLVLEGSQLGFWDWNIATGEIKRNEHCAKMLGYSMEEIPFRDQQWTELIHPDDRLHVRQSLQQHLKGLSHIHRCEYRMRTKDGQYHWILDQGRIMLRDTQGYPIRMCGTHTDITERKRAEEELLLYHDHLEDLVTQRTSELAEARDQAQAANRAKSVFLANMSHELRTPLTAVIGFAEIMSKDAVIQGRTRENLAIIMRSGEHLLALINDILDLSKIEAGRIDVDRHDVDLGEIIRDVINMMRGRAEAKGLQLVLDQSSEFPRFVNTDSNKLRQILVNLISNAIKFTYAGQVTIRLAATPMTDGHVLAVEVRDTGIGISREDHDRIFRPFEQIGNKGTEGTGLGLAITRKYVQMLDGRIQVDSESGHGSCFSFTIQVGQVSLANARALPVSRYLAGISSPTKDIRILIVEDQPENRLLLKCFLEPLNFQISEAVNGQEAVAIFQEWHPHLVFMDRRMPVMDGLEAVRRIKALPGGDETIVIAVSAHSFKEEQQKMLEAGCNDFIGKPFGGEELLNLISKHLHLDFIYANREEPPPVVSMMLASGDLRILSPDSLKILHRLANECDEDKLGKWLESQHDLSPALQATFSSLLKDYRFDVILEAVEPLLPTKSEM